MPIEKHKLERIIKDAFPESSVKVIDLVGDNDHYSVEIKSKLFNDKSIIEQHRMVNNILKSCLGTTLHALQIKTLKDDNNE